MQRVGIQEELHPLASLVLLNYDWIRSAIHLKLQGGPHSITLSGI